ncbi:MAG: hypothetical protein ACOCXJ_05745, partial [Planctomycetota bacterium]
DRAEILTRAWQAHAQHLLPALHERIASATGDPAPDSAPEDGFLRVDMDEYHRVGSGGRIGTFGVSTCTAVIVCLPGSFAYLGHCSVADAIYGEPDGTDLIGGMLRDIRDFEIPRARMRHLRATVVAPHLDSLPGVIERLLDAGLLLDQIVLRHQDDADHAIVAHACAATGGCHTEVDWVGGTADSRSLRLDRLVHGLLATDSQPPPLAHHQ